LKCGQLVWTNHYQRRGSHEREGYQGRRVGAKVWHTSAEIYW
jgi:hypothetical protein